VTRRNSCSGCGYDGLFQFLNLGTSPIADAYTSSVDEMSKEYPLDVAVCVKCRLVQLLEVIDGPTLFGSGYSFYSSASKPLSDYHEKYANSVIQNFDNKDKKLVLEIGCNDGDMLRHFREAKYSTLGVDPASGPVKNARERGLDVWESEFTSEIAAQIYTEIGPAGIVIANHVLAHVEDVSDTLHGITTVLEPDGVAFIEVQYLPDLLVNNAFDLVYHEHRNFFSLSTLETLVHQHGMHIVNAELTARQGGSLRVVVRRQGHGAPANNVYTIQDSEWWLNSGLMAYEGLQGRIERIRARLWDVLTPWLDKDIEIAGYGAPAKATTLLNFCEIDSDVLQYVVDSTPAKQGRFIPGTGIEIIPEGLQADAYLLTAWNYASEIIPRYSRDVRWIIPIPAPMVI